MKNIETSFRQLRLFGIVYLCACTLLVGFSVWKAYGFAEAQRQKIYVLDEGKSLMLALSQDLEQNRPVEAREHIRRFHELFFTLSPDKSAIEGNIQRAMFLSDRSAYAHYRDLAEQGYYNRVISGNMNQRIGIDSVKCDFNTYPYEVVTYARLSIIREKSVTQVFKILCERHKKKYTDRSRIEIKNTEKINAGNRFSRRKSCIFYMLHYLWRLS